MVAIETAANLGEALGGLAIMFTLLFGLRQLSETNRNRRYEIAQTIASSLENPLVQRGFSVYANKLYVDMPIDEIGALTREEKDAMNSVIILMSNHAIMTFNRQLSFEIVYSFYRGYLRLIGPSIRRTCELIEGMYVMIERINVDEENGFAMFHWVYWLLDRMEEFQETDTMLPHINEKDWKP